MEHQTNWFPRNQAVRLHPEAIAWEGEAILDEGSGHQGPAYLTPYVAQRALSTTNLTREEP